VNTSFLISFLLPCLFQLSGKNNTPINPATKTIEELLTQHSWKADEIRIQLSNNTTQYYKRGGKDNTVDYDSDVLKFQKNHTGIYYFEGAQFSTTWKFTDAKKTKMTITIDHYFPIIVHLENIHVTEKYFKYVQYYTGDISYLASCTRKPLLISEDAFSSIGAN
jgi:hypothetical protein